MVMNVKGGRCRQGDWTYGMLDRCSVADGGKMLLKFLDPGFLKRCRAEPEKSRVSACSSCPAPPRGSCTTGCLDSVTRITLPWRRWPFRWLIAVGGRSHRHCKCSRHLRRYDVITRWPETMTHLLFIKIKVSDQVEPEWRRSSGPKRFPSYWRGFSLSERRHTHLKTSTWSITCDTPDQWS